MLHSSVSHDFSNSSRTFQPLEDRTKRRTPIFFPNTALWFFRWFSKRYPVLRLLLCLGDVRRQEKCTRKIMESGGRNSGYQIGLVWRWGTPSQNQRRDPQTGALPSPYLGSLGVFVGRVWIPLMSHRFRYCVHLRELPPLASEQRYCQRIYQLYLQIRFLVPLGFCISAHQDKKDQGRELFGLPTESHEEPVFQAEALVCNKLGIRLCKSFRLSSSSPQVSLGGQNEDSTEWVCWQALCKFAIHQQNIFRWSSYRSNI